MRLQGFAADATLARALSPFPNLGPQALPLQSRFKDGYVRTDHKAILYDCSSPLILIAFLARCYLFLSRGCKFGELFEQGHEVIPCEALRL